MEGVINSIRIQYVNTGRVNETEEVICFQNKHKKLYEKLTSKDCDEIMLKSLLQLYKKLETGSISQDKADQAFGHKAAEKYVMPLVNN